MINFEHFCLEHKIGHGSFGDIFLGTDLENGKSVAIKLESNTSLVPQLEHEAKLYKYLQGFLHIPKTIWFGSIPNYHVLVMQLLGKSLEELHQTHNKFSLKTILMLADQMLLSIQFLHSKNFIHRDIKPDNFVLGSDQNSGVCYLIDFGLAKQYRNPNNHAHISYIEGKSFTGTARYGSINALQGNEQSRRDDLESLGYVWLYLIKGKLPWMGLGGKNREQKYQRILEKKESISIEELCQDLPIEFCQYFKSIRKLKFDEKPNYSRYRRLFRDLFIRHGYAYDCQFDWCTEKNIGLFPNDSFADLKFLPKCISTDNILSVVAVNQSKDNQNILSPLADQGSDFDFDALFAH